MGMVTGFTPSSSLSANEHRRGWWFLCSGDHVFVTGGCSGVSIPFIDDPGQIGVEAKDVLYLGDLHGNPCFAASTPRPDTPPPGMLIRSLRTLYGELEDGLFQLAETAIHLVGWNRKLHYCSRCRAELRLKADERAKECPECGQLEFPRISPAIIVLVERGDKLLLARAARFTEPFYSVLAGFVEPGESMEETVRREIREEVGIEIKDIRYFGSQPWPFPDSLMIGFTAVHAGGEIKIDGKEIVDADWFDVDHLPLIPGRISIARKLIDWFIEKQSKK
jgi:NAD+ diphosphatase